LTKAFLLRKSQATNEHSRDDHYPVSSEISDFTPCAHTQSNILHIKCTKKSDD